MTWVFAALAAWLLPVVLMLVFTLLFTLWRQCLKCVNASRSRLAGQGVGDEPGPQTGGLTYTSRSALAPVLRHKSAASSNSLSRGVT
jgi:hypothetical protein